MQLRSALVLTNPAAATRARWVPRLPPLTPPVALFVGAAALYASAAVYLVFGMHLIVGDALSRVGNAYYVLFSRDPHLAAIGFVWNPLPSLLILPLTPFKLFWPALVSQGFAANVISIVAMAAAVSQLWKLLRELRLTSLQATSLTVVFALHPMTIQYGANGDSEALFLLTLFVLARALSRWMDTRSTASLATSGLALAAAYLTRYEAVAVAFGVVLLVGTATYLRQPSDRRRSFLAGLADVAIVGVPFVAVFVGWAFVSWVIVGSPFEQFSSIYGTASQLQAGGASLDSLNRPGLVLGQVLGLAPLALPLGGLALLGAVLWSKPRLVVPLVIFASVLLFAVVAWLLGKTGGWLRYYITVVPLAVVGAAAILEAPLFRRPGAAWRGLAGVGFTLVIFAASIGNVTAVQTMRDVNLGREDHYKGFDVVRWQLSNAIAGYLDARKLGSGAVPVDTFLGYSIVLISDNPKQFVITSDRDFRPSVADPIAFHVQYVLVPQGGGLGMLDAIERQWPGMYGEGAGIGTLVKEFSVPNGGGQRWRLYRLRS